VSVSEFLVEARAKGIEVTLSEGRLISRAAKGALTPAIAAALRERKAEILAFLQSGLAEREGSRPTPQIMPAPRQELMPLSFTQERLWYLSQVESDPAVFNLPLCLHITGPLRVEVLRRSLDAIANRHEALRTSLVVRDGEAFQTIHPPRGLPLSEVNFCGRDREASGRTPLEVLTREAATPFDLVAGPPVRTTLVQVTDEEHYLLVMMHHIITDGTSLAIFLEELVALYEAFSTDLHSPLTPLALQYADYAVWQREWLQGAALDEQLTYWKRQLVGKLPVLDLPTDFIRPAVRGATGSKEPLRLPRDVLRELTGIALEEGATTYMAMVALFNALLHRYTGQEDLIIGTPVANRTRRESEGIFGYVANTLVLRTDVSGAPSFRELVRRVRDGCSGAFRHQDMPFQKIVEAIQPPRDLSRTPIFQVFLTYEEVFSQPPRMGDLALSRVIVGSTVARQDLSVFLRQVDGEVLGSLEYNKELFKRESVLRLIGHFQTLGQSAAADPDRPIATLNMLTARERDEFDAFNATAMPCPDTLVHQLIEAQTVATPQREAIRAGKSSLTYRELNDTANRLARMLQSRGIGRGDLVGICLERSPEMVVAMLAILKAGAAYVPMDPDFPAGRLAFMAEDARLSAVVTDRVLRDRAPAGIATQVCVDDEEIRAASPEALGISGVEPGDRAYVIYTSGSTGKPKGVEVLHRNVVNFLTTMRDRPGIAQNDVLVAVTTLSFDIAVLELVLPLTVGACVIIATRDASRDGARLAELMRTEGATMMQATPATWRLLLQSGWTGQRDLKALCGGEALTGELARRLIPVVGELWNMYGPTETTIWSTCARLVDPAAPVTIGTPIGNTVVRIIGKDGQQTPLGIAGELQIGGEGVARGYLGRPELTADRFGPDPVNPAASRIRFYKTGDLVRMHPGGQIEYLGRLDTQVKVQGYRIELGEIESLLSALPEICEAAAAVRSYGAGDARLVAYVAFHAGLHLTPSEVRRGLRDQLPMYMIPGLIVELKALPRTLNGKIDRGALPDPLATAPVPREFVPPRTTAEHIVAEAWQALLPQQKVGRHDNFFELGGHSLLSIRAVAAIQQQTGTRIDPRLMFFQTVEQIAAGLEPALVAHAV